MRGKKTAGISGIFGMDAKNLAGILLEKGYEVTGTYRYTSISLDERKNTLDFADDIKFVSMDITDYSGVSQVITNGQYDLFFNLCAQSNVWESFKNPYYAIQCNGIGVLNVLESVRQYSLHTRIYSAQTSEQFGFNKEEISPGVFEQNDSTPYSANSPYGAGKLLAHNLLRIYREAYGIFAVGGILFNHTNPGTRTPSFFERKVSVYVANLKKWSVDNFTDLKSADLIRSDKEITSNVTGNTFKKLGLGTIEGVYRDIGWSHDYMRAAYMMITNDEPKDYIVATGEAHPITDILEIMFGRINLNYKDFIYTDPEFVRPVDVPYLRGNSSSIREELGWESTKTFSKLMTSMVDYDLKEVANGG